MHVTMNDVAKAAGVALSTASRALANNPRVSVTTREQIQKLAREMGYVPSAIARGLATKRTYALGVVVRDIVDPFIAELVRLIDVHALELGYSLILSHSGNAEQRERAAINILRQQRVDAIIMPDSSVSDSFLSQVTNEGIPIHFIDFDGRPYAHLVGPRFPLFGLSKAQAQAARERHGLELAAAFVEGKIRNQINLIKYYSKSQQHRDAVFDAQCRQAITKIQALLDQVETLLADQNLEQAHARLFAVEGNSASHYWNLIKSFLSADIFFTGRQRQGATDLVNSLLNYGYGILYGRVHEAVILAGLNPNISFLHAEQVGKPTLVFDLVEEFRQPAVDRAIIAMIRRKETLDMEGAKLNQATRQKIVDAVIERLNARVRYRSQRIPLREVIHRQAKALAKALESRGRYRPFIIQW